MAPPLHRPATIADLAALPAHVVGEIVGGELHASPRPAARHAAVSSLLGSELTGPFWKSRGGPGGWIILDEPELHLGADVLVPDLAAWRRTRMPELPDVAAFTLVLTAGGDAVVRAEPFDAIELALASLWAR